MAEGDLTGPKVVEIVGTYPLSCGCSEACSAAGAIVPANVHNVHGHHGTAERRQRLARVERVAVPIFLVVISGEGVLIERQYELVAHRPAYDSMRGV